MASLCSKRKSVFSTPVTLKSACLTVIGQAAHVMPGTDSVTVCVAAQTGTVTTAIASAASSFFMTNSLSIEQGQYVGETERDQYQRDHDPEDELVRGAHLWNRAHFARLACRSLPEDAPSGEEQRHQCRADENRAPRFKHRQIADPGAAHAQRDEHQRPEAAGRREDRGKSAGGKCAAPVLLCSHTHFLPNLE